ncbi:hypothetical protein QTA58_22605 [Neorhizobium sp. CSC1952]|uniref:hypothetical protein n=1 Tax=Neorhizobium sp. CSC1952 TaxID=2978974 RepID=UPI0025A5039F|nr:hypothetical protein [Rhizobium sp. CSC1952]WJR66946.1 hypothetical protein QTA58_22605 [Rhizobium sp. CSC1952]
MALSFEDLKNTSTEELKKQYDGIAGSTVVGLNFYRDEIARRDAEVQNQRMLDFTEQVRNMTRWITGMTAVMLILTIVNICIAWNN